MTVSSTPPSTAATASRHGGTRRSRWTWLQRLPRRLKLAPLPWPLPAVLAWSAGWLLWRLMLAAGVGPGFAWAAGCTAAGLLALACRGTWRRAISLLGFPLATWAAGAAHGVAVHVWLLPLGLLLVAYPLRAWRDAPFFPTPANGLQGLAEVVGQPARVLDAGCGLGHGLRALAALWPQAQIQGVEWSPVLALGARLWARQARVSRGDMWAGSWAPFDLVYLFQRPESMARAWAKARSELKPGAWLVSLEFPVQGVRPAASLQGPGRRTVWIYRV